MRLIHLQVSFMLTWLFGQDVRTASYTGLGPGVRGGEGKATMNGNPVLEGLVNIETPAGVDPVTPSGRWSVQSSSCMRFHGDV